MSIVHRILRNDHDEGASSEPPPQAAAPPAPMDSEVRSKERRLKAGIQQLQDTIAELRTKLRETEQAAASLQEENDRLKAELKRRRAPRPSPPQGLPDSGSLLAQAKSRNGAR